MVALFSLLFRIHGAMCSRRFFRGFKKYARRPSFHVACILWPTYVERLPLSSPACKRISTCAVAVQGFYEPPPKLLVEHAEHKNTAHGVALYLDPKP